MGRSTFRNIVGASRGDLRSASRLAKTAAGNGIKATLTAFLSTPAGWITAAAIAAALFAFTILILDDDADYNTDALQVTPSTEAACVVGDRYVTYRYAAEEHGVPWSLLAGIAETTTQQGLYAPTDVEFPFIDLDRANPADDDCEAIAALRDCQADKARTYVDRIGLVLAAYEAQEDIPADIDEVYNNAHHQDCNPAWFTEAALLLSKQDNLAGRSDVIVDVLTGTDQIHYNTLETLTTAEFIANIDTDALADIAYAFASQDNITTEHATRAFTNLYGVAPSALGPVLALGSLEVAALDDALFGVSGADAAKAFTALWLRSDVEFVAMPVSLVEYRESVNRGPHTACGGDRCSVYPFIGDSLWGPRGPYLISDFDLSDADVNSLEFSAEFIAERLGSARDELVLLDRYADWEFDVEVASAMWAAAIQALPITDPVDVVVDVNCHEIDTVSLGLDEALTEVFTCVFRDWAPATLFGVDGDARSQVIREALAVADLALNAPPAKWLNPDVECTFVVPVESVDEDGNPVVVMSTSVEVVPGVEVFEPDHDLRPIGTVVSESHDAESGASSVCVLVTLAEQLTFPPVPLFGEFGSPYTWEDIEESPVSEAGIDIRQEYLIDAAEVFYNHVVNNPELPEAGWGAFLDIHGTVEQRDQYTLDGPFVVTELSLDCVEWVAAEVHHDGLGGDVAARFASVVVPDCAVAASTEPSFGPQFLQVLERFDEIGVFGGVEDGELVDVEGDAHGHPHETIALTEADIAAVAALIAAVELPVYETAIGGYHPLVSRLASFPVSVDLPKLPQMAKKFAAEVAVRAVNEAIRFGGINSFDSRRPSRSGFAVTVGGSAIALKALDVSQFEYHAASSWVSSKCAPGPDNRGVIEFIALFDQACAAGDALGYPFVVSSGSRTSAQQQHLYDIYGPSRAAVPGTSTHERGAAIDISSTNGALTWLHAVVGCYYSLTSSYIDYPADISHLAYAEAVADSTVVVDTAGNSQDTCARTGEAPIKRAQTFGLVPLCTSHSRIARWFDNGLSAVGTPDVEGWNQADVIECTGYNPSGIMREWWHFGPGLMSPVSHNIAGIIAKYFPESEIDAAVAVAVANGGGSWSLVNGDLTNGCGLRDNDDNTVNVGPWLINIGDPTGSNTPNNPYTCAAGNTLVTGTAWSQSVGADLYRDVTGFAPTSVDQLIAFYKDPDQATQAANVLWVDGFYTYWNDAAVKADIVDDSGVVTGNYLTLTGGEDFSGTSSSAQAARRLASPEA